MQISVVVCKFAKKNKTTRILMNWIKFCATCLSSLPVDANILGKSISIFRNFDETNPDNALKASELLMMLLKLLEDHYQQVRNLLICMVLVGPKRKILLFLEMQVMRKIPRQPQNFFFN